MLQLQAYTELMYRQEITLKLSHLKRKIDNIKFKTDIV